MKVYRMEDLRINQRIGRSRPTGTYEITRIGTSRAVTRFCETYATDAGEFIPEKWLEIVRKCADESNSTKLLERIVEHCRTNCVWLKTDKDREDYALNILVGRTYHHWKDFSLNGLTENSSFVFEFEGGKI